MPENETIVVIGAGVIGLTTALRLQQSLPKNSHKSILLVARDWPTTTSLNYASPWAGAHYRPVPGKTAQSLREETQAQATYTYFKSACQDAASGIAKVEGVEHLENPPDEYRDQTAIETYYDHLDGFRYLRKEEMPEGVVWGVRYETFVVNSPVYLAYLLRKFILLGGRTREYTLADPREAFYLADGESGNVRTVVNCSGVGFGDEKSFIIRGQTCLVRNPTTTTLTRQNADGTWSFSIPRPLDGGTIIGGTKGPNDWDPNPSLAVRETLLANAKKWFPFTEESGGEFDVVRDIVGRRPAREGGMRIEVEHVDVGVGGGSGKAGKGKRIVHGYGAAGRGYELSWGVAGDVVRLVLEGEEAGREKAKL